MPTGLAQTGGNRCSKITPTLKSFIFIGPYFLKLLLFRVIDALFGSFSQMACHHVTVIPHRRQPTWLRFVSTQLTAENTNGFKCPAASIIVSWSTLADISFCQN